MKINKYLKRNKLISRKKVWESKEGKVSLRFKRNIKLVPQQMSNNIQLWSSFFHDIQSQKIRRKIRGIIWFQNLN